MIFLKAYTIHYVDRCTKSLGNTSNQRNESCPFIYRSEIIIATGYKFIEYLKAFNKHE